MIEIKVVITGSDAREHYDRGGKPELTRYFDQESITFSDDGYVFDFAGNSIGTWEIVRD